MAGVSLSCGQAFNLQPLRVRVAKETIGDDEARHRLTITRHGCILRGIFGTPFSRRRPSCRGYS